MNFGIISKKCKNVIIILLIGTILLPYFSGTNIAKADNIPSDDSGEFDRCPVEAVQAFTF